MIPECKGRPSQVFQFADGSKLVEKLGYQSIIIAKNKNEGRLGNYYLSNHLGMQCTVVVDFTSLVKFEVEGCFWR